MATSEATIRKIHADIVSSKLPANVSAKWTIFSAARGLKVEEDYDGNTVREGDIHAFVKDYSSPDYEGSILFALVKLAIPNTQPVAEKCALIEWCDTNAPPLMRNNFFPGQSNALKKLLPGYNVPMEIRNREDLTAEEVLQKVGGAAPQSSSRGPGGPPPPVASKPIVSRPSRVGGGGTGFNPLGGRGAPQGGDVDQDGWGTDAPPVTRSQLEKVESAYKPTKVDLGSMRSQQEPSRYTAPQRDDAPSDVVRGGYQPIGKVDIAEIRRRAKDSGNAQDERPTTVKGAYEPVGKVDIAAIRAKAQGPGSVSSPPARISPAGTGASAQDDEAPKSLAERSAAFSQSERLASLPKPKVANKFGSSGNSFAGTKAPTPAGLGPKPTTSAPVGIASRTFADEGGKTPAQIWAEKKARQGGAPPPVQAQPSGISSQASGDGGWKSGYSGKSWAAVQTTHTGKSAGSNISAQKTGQEEQEDEPVPAGGVGAIRDRFKDAAPIGMGAPPPPRAIPELSSPPQMDMSSKPNAGGPRGVPIPGLPTRPSAAPEEDEYPEEQTQHIPPPPAQPRSPSPPTPDEMRSSSPVRIAMPVGRGPAPEPAAEPEQPVPAASLSKIISQKEELYQELDEEPQVEDNDPARSAAQTVGGSSAPAATGGQRAQIQYDYEPAEDNEIELREGDFVTNIDMVDDDWWMGVNSKGEQGLFPSNYVELVEDEQPVTPAPAARSVPPPPAAAPAASKGTTATAQYDYEAAEDNELSFPDGATITGVEFPDDDWWFGHYGGKEGLFPANYVQLDQ